MRNFIEKLCIIYHLFKDEQFVFFSATLKVENGELKCKGSSCYTSASSFLYECAAEFCNKHKDGDF